jgi:hypothetical protein
VILWQISGKQRLSGEVGEVVCLVELRGFEPLTSCNRASLNGAVLIGQHASIT